MGISDWLHQKTLNGRREQLAKDLSFVWRGLVSNAPSNATLEQIVEQYGSRIPMVLDRYYQDMLEASRRPGQEHLIRRAAMDGILLAKTHSGYDLKVIRIHMGVE